MRKVFVTIGFHGKRYSFLMDGRIMENGRTEISQEAIEKILDSIGVYRGQTYSIG